MTDMHFSPSLIAADFTRLGEEIDAAVTAGADSLHFDVMDHHYVPNLSIGPMVSQSIHKRFPELFLDVHLMVTDPDNYIDAFAKAGAAQISVHPETCPNTTNTLKKIHELGICPGVVFNPDQAVELDNAWLPYVKHILIMSVYPGFGGQKFIPESIAKIKTTREWLDNRKLDISLAVDGGISPQTVGDCARAGANFFVVGSALFGTESYEKTLQKLRSNCA
jgi:ribulose-phosphate 3-epimerase